MFRLNLYERRKQFELERVEVMGGGGADLILRISMICTLHEILLGWSNLSRMRWAGRAALMEDMRNAYKILVGKPEGKSSLGRTERKWKYNIKNIHYFLGK
jgi:hypothetical protein